MPRPREKDKHLPQHVQWKHGAYYFTKGKWIRLGSSLSEMYIELAKLQKTPNKLRTMQDIFDRYMIEIAPTKAESTYKKNRYEIVLLGAYFGRMLPPNVTPVHVYRYRDQRAKKAPVRANREISLLSHVFTMAIMWGATDTNPCFFVKRLRETPRDREVTFEEFLAVRSIANPQFKLIMDFADITGMRLTDILKVKLSDIKEEGIEVLISKTKKITNKKKLYEWTPDLREVVRSARSLPRHIASLYLFFGRSGKKYSEDGFESVWQKIMGKTLELGLITERFMFRDIRPRAGTAAHKMGGREYAQELLGHSDPKTTEIYIRGVKRIRPVR